MRRLFVLCLAFFSAYAGAQTISADRAFIPAWHDA